MWGKRQLQALAALIGCACAATTGFGVSSAKASEGSCKASNIKFTATPIRTVNGLTVFRLDVSFVYAFQDSEDDLSISMLGKGGDYDKDLFAEDYGAKLDTHFPYEVQVRLSVTSQPVDAPDRASWLGPMEDVEIGSVDCGNAGTMINLVRGQQPAGGSRGCPDYAVLDTRGSEFHPALAISPPGAAFVAALRKAVKPATVGVWMNPYPAVGGPWGIFSAGFHLPIGYHRSVEEGKKALENKVDWYAKYCQQTTLFLVGYSQGAQITGDAYQEHYTGNVRGVALFGDPRYNRADGQADYHQLKFDGLLGTRRPFAGMEASRAASFCHAQDPFCQKDPALFRYWTTYHKNYGSPDEIRAAVRYFIRK